MFLRTDTKKETCLLFLHIHQVLRTIYSLDYRLSLTISEEFIGLKMDLNSKEYGGKED